MTGQKCSLANGSIMIRLSDLWYAQGIKASDIRKRIEELEHDGYKPERNESDGAPSSSIPILRQHDE